jgi:two-component system, NarL family, sensor histidine kinase UhpB
MTTSQPYRRLVERSPDGILISQDGILLFVNPAAGRLCGRERPEDLVGSSLTDVFGADRDALRRERLERVTSGQPAAPFDEQLVGLDGSLTDVEVAVTRLDDPESPSSTPAIVFTMREISARKRAEAALRESEERLTLAFAGAQEGVWDWNLVTGDVVYSPRWKQMLGYADHEIEPHVSAWERLLHPDDMPRAQEVNANVARGAGAYEGEFRLRHRDGHYVQVLSRGYPVRQDPAGPVVRIVGTHFDLTERRQAEAERARTELLSRLVFAQEDERRRIAREMHDQFGEQLTALSRGIIALKDACGGSPGLSSLVGALETIARQIDRDVDQLVWQLRPTALDDLGLRAALANYVQDWSRRVNIPAELHTSGLLDDRLASEAETTLYRVAQEALTNVAKHSRAKRVDVILERQADTVLLIVEDDGVGFDAGAEGTPGDGFGLLGMQERAALVGATVEIESTAGKGTTVFLRMAVPPATRNASDHG